MFIAPRECDRTPRYIRFSSYIVIDMAKHLIELDETMLSAARAELRTRTIKETVNEALRRATLGRESRVTKALDVLAEAHLHDRSDAWR